KPGRNTSAPRRNARSSLLKSPLPQAREPFLRRQTLVLGRNGTLSPQLSPNSPRQGGFSPRIMPVSQQMTRDSPRILLLQGNRVGGSLTAPVLPHHRTYSRIRRFLSVSKRSDLVGEAEESLVPGPLVRHGLARSGAA